VNRPSGLLGSWSWVAPQSPNFTSAVACTVRIQQNFGLLPIVHQKFSEKPRPSIRRGGIGAVVEWGISFGDATRTIPPKSTHSF